MRKDILERKEEILKWVEQNQSKAFISRQLNCKPETLNAYLEKMGIEYKGNMGSKGLKINHSYISAIEYAAKPQGVKSHVLKEKLIRDGIKAPCCEICGLSEWMGKPIPLELHHKNNKHYDNNLDNLQILCPNCHAQQPGNSGANIGNAVVLEQVDNAHLECAAEGRVGSSPTDSTIKNFCVDCGKEINKRSTRCEECFNIHSRIVERPCRDELKTLIRAKPFTTIAKDYGVSDNAVRKWCDFYNLPRKKKEINNYSNEEWVNV